MAKFNIKSQQQNNSHPRVKIAIREWILNYINPVRILDVYGGYGLMYKKIWSKLNIDYDCSSGDAIDWLNNQSQFNQNIFDIDPYASPYEALEIIGQKAICNKIGIICTDGTLRRVAMMRTEIPKFIQSKCNWPGRDFNLMAGIYYQYPKFLRHVLNCLMTGWKTDRLAVQYGKGTWRQATVYWSGLFSRE